MNSMIKMKLLEMKRVKEVWNEYAANKIKLTIMKSENNWLKLKFIIHNSFDKLDELTEIIWEIQKENVLFSEREEESLQRVCREFAKN